MILLPEAASSLLFKSEASYSTWVLGALDKISHKLVRLTLFFHSSQTFSPLTSRTSFSIRDHTKVQDELSCFTASDSTAKSSEVTSLSSHISNTPEIHTGPDILPRALMLPWKRQYGWWYRSKSVPEDWSCIETVDGEWHYSKPELTGRPTKLMISKLRPSIRDGRELNDVCASPINSASPRKHLNTGKW